MFFFFVYACPIINCTNLDIGVCATKSSDNLNVNIYGCPVGTYGIISNLPDWYYNQGSYFYCQQCDLPNITSDLMPCGNRNLNQRLKDGIHPKRCLNEKDCELKNGDFSKCQCGLDGFSYCMPLLGAEVFDLYWVYCENGNGYTSEGVWKYFKDIRDYYSYYVTAPSCAQNIFCELQYIFNVFVEWGDWIGPIFLTLIY